MRNDYLDYLMHYGVKGMKWGVRNDRSSSLPSPKRLALTGATAGSGGPEYYNASYKVTRETSYKRGKLKNTKFGSAKSESSNKTSAASNGSKLSDSVKKIMEKLQKSKTPEEKAEAKKEAEKEVKKTTEKGKSWFEQTLKAGKDKPKVSAAEKVTSTSEKGVSDLVKLRNLRDTHKNNKSAAKSLSEISTEDLRKIVANAKERDALEADYRKYVANSVSSGRKRTTETLETLGAMLAVAGSAVTIISTVKSFKNGKDDD